VPTIFKKCPSCGRRFEVERTGESVDKKTDVVTEEKPLSPPSLIPPVSLPDIPVEPPPTVVVAEEIEEDDYTETYKCKHCGHVWTEEHAIVEDLGEVTDAGLDRRP
jgi:DNA-directed RNA polymerase subunit RPC12/RpoP